MFGYVRINKPELKIGDYDVYKGVYCSLCKELGHSFGLFSKFTLSYDFTFLAILKMSINDKCNKFKKSRCNFNPFKKCNCCEKENESVNFSANVAIIMLYYKVKDNIDDGGFFKRALMYLILPIVALYHKKAKQNLPDINNIVSNAMEQQRKLEDDKCDSIDAAANPTSYALGEIFAYGETDEQQARVLKHFGYCIGRYVYIMDATDDLQDDLNEGQYNALILSNGLSTGDDVNPSREKAYGIIDRTISEIINTYELLNLLRYHNIIENIVYEGLNLEKEKLIMSNKKEVDV
ncbi:MAG: DUF5685 family protein [Oscillospiraceae bacterium]